MGITRSQSLITTVVENITLFTFVAHSNHSSLCPISDYTNDILGLAILNQETFNPVLLTVIRVIMNCTERSVS